MDIKNRQLLREEILGDLYDHYFETGGEDKTIREDVLEDKERHLAYVYLAQQRLISLNINSANKKVILDAFATINGIGVDRVEQYRLKKVVEAGEMFS